MDTAFEILAEQHRPMLLGYARALMNGEEHDAEDVVQETLLAAHRSLATFDKGANFAGWLRGIARNKALESRRAARRRRIVVDSRIVEGIEEVYALFDAASPGEENWTERMQRLLHKCLERLTQNLRDAVVRVYREELSLHDAAAAMNVSHSALAQRLSRARELLRQCVRTHGGNEP
jgi:RNA polymerase sigma factor CnrH